MISGKKLRPEPRGPGQYLSSAPGMEVFTSYLRELLIAAPGSEFDFSWQANNQHFTMVVSYSRRAGVAAWKLYKGEADTKQLLWEHLTNDIPLIHKQVILQINNSPNSFGANGAPQSAQANSLQSESKSDSYMIRNLQKLFVEAQNERGPNQTAVSGNAVPPIPYSDSQSLGYSIPESPAPAAAHTPIITSFPTYTVDLTRGRGLLQSLLLNEIGILSYPAFLYLLEQEYYKTQTCNSAMTIMVASLCTISRQDGSCSRAAWPKSVTAKALQQIRANMRKTDVLAAYENGCVIFLLPDTELTGAKLLARKIGRFCSNHVIWPQSDQADTRPTFGLAALGDKLNTLPVLLGAAEKALQEAEQSARPIFAYENHSANAPPDAISPLPQKTINLAPMRHLLSQLRAQGTAIFTYAAWLVFLEREFYRAQRQRKELYCLLLRLRLTDIDSFDPANTLSPPALAEAFRRIGQIQRPGDIIGHFTQGSYALLRPTSSLAAIETFARQISKALSTKALANDYDHDELKIVLHVCAVRGNPQFPEALMFHKVETSQI